VDDYWLPFASRRKFDNSEGVNESYTIKTRAIGKGNHQNFPYLIANEWIAANVGHFLGLPIPPFGLMRKADNRTAMFASVRFDGKIPTQHADPDVLWARDKELCAGILLFDILIANCDRHAGNIKVNSKANPTRVHIFDHDRALFHVYPGEGIKRLGSLVNRIGISGGKISGGNRHCLIDVIDSADYFLVWIDRIFTMPRPFIQMVCGRKGIGISNAEIREVVGFLDDRRMRLPYLLKSEKAQFSKITHWPML